MSYSSAAILKGAPYLAPYGTKTPEPLGNSSKVTYSVELDEKELPDYENSGGGVDTKSTRVKSAKIVINLRKVPVKNLELALGGNATSFAAGNVPAEAHTAGSTGSLVMLDFPQDMTQPMTVTPDAGVDPYVEGEDYRRVRAGFVLLEGGAIAADEKVKVAYSKLAGHNIEALVDINRDYYLVLDGVNEVDEKPVLGEFYKVKFTPAKSIEFIGDDFVSLDLEGTLQKDETKTGVGLSQYMRVRTGF